MKRHKPYSQHVILNVCSTKTLYRQTQLSF